MQTTQVIYDGSFDGFLTSVFDCYQYRIVNPILIKESRFNKTLFAETLTVYTNTEHADRVWNGLKKHIGTKGCNFLYFSFLSELNAIENTMLNVVKYAFYTKKNIISDFGHPDVLSLSKIVKKVGREKHRMEAFVRFQETKDHIYFSHIEPDFNVLPLIAKHFAQRYADQKWIIYDIKRHYGMYYNLSNTQTITLSNDTRGFGPEIFTDNEKAYETLWKDYFKSTNIEERINTALHVKHVPKRYWKYLSEKQP